MSQSPVRFAFDTTSVEQAELLFSGSYAPVKVRPLQGTAIDVRLSAVASQGVTVFSTICPTGVRFETESSFDGYNLTIPVSGRFEMQGIETGWQQQAEGGALMVDARQVTRADFSSNLAFYGISVGSDELHAALAEWLDGPVTGRIQFNAALPIRSGAVQLATMLANVMQDGLSGDAPLASAPAALASLRQAILKLMLEAVPHSYSDQLARSPVLVPTPAHVRRAIDFMVAHVSEPITVNDIARFATTTPRSLQAAFRRFKGVTPTIYLRQLRLSGARRDLLDASMPTRHPCSIRTWRATTGLKWKNSMTLFRRIPRPGVWQQPISSGRW